MRCATSESELGKDRIVGAIFFPHQLGVVIVVKVSRFNERLDRPGRRTNLSGRSGA